ncbi:MAG: DedA family protein [Spirochaetota bacterium]|nr:DedA family protein [Spirochaetota bacterium]
MANLLNRILEFILPANDLIIYLFLFLSAIIENLFPPIPGDTITVFGAFLVGTGRLDYLLVYLTTTIGSVIGFMILFIIGKSIGRDYFHNKDYKFFSEKNINAAEGWFLKYGYLVVLGNRFLPGIRSVISIVSGFSKLKTIKVSLYALISSSIWNLIWIHTGFLLGDNWEIVRGKIGKILNNYNIVITIFIIIIIIVIILIYKRRNK